MRYIIFLILFPLLLSAQTVEYYKHSSIPETYTVRKGKNLFSDGSLPFNLLGRSKKIDTLRGRFAFHEDCVYDFGTDRDQRDWNKLTGIQFWQTPRGLFNPNLNNIMLAWRYNVNGWFEVAPFINKKKKWELGKVIRVPDFHIFSQFEITREKKGRWSITIMSGQTFLHQTFDVNEKRQARLIPPWFGGENNDPDGLPYGGKAPHEMSIQLSCELIK